MASCEGFNGFQTEVGVFYHGLARDAGVSFGTEPANHGKRPQASAARMRTDASASSYTDHHRYHQRSVRRNDRLVCDVVIDASAEATRVQTPRV